MQVNFGLLDPNAFERGRQNSLAMFEQGRQMRREQDVDNALKAFAADPSNPQSVNALLPHAPGLAMQLRGEQQRQAESAQRQQAGSLYASGDRQGAQKAAIQSGNFELAGQFLALDEASQKRVAQKYQAAGPVLLKAQEIPYEGRRSLIAAAAPMLMAQGWTQEEIAGFNPTDEALQGLGAAAMTVEQVLDSGKVKWVTGEWGAFATDASGRPVAPGAVGAPTNAMPQQQAQQPAQGGGFDAFYSGFLAPAEGGYTSSDGRSGAPANFGINQKFHQGPGHEDHSNVRNITPEIAKRVAYEEYWVPSGADQIADPALQAIHADTAFNAGVGRAKQFLDQSGGDPQRYLQIREQHYRKLGGAELPGWLNRNEKLAQFAGGASRQAPQQAPQQGAPSIQEQAMSGVIQAGQKPPPGFRFAPDGQSLEPIPGGPGDKTQERIVDTRQEATALRKEFNDQPDVKKFNEVRNSTLQIRELATSVPDNDPGRAQADMALIFAFMKALDPGSTVREGEFATAQNAAGVPDRIRNYFNAARNGQKLNQQQRQGMVRAAEDVYRTRARTYNEIARTYHPLFSELGVENPKAFAPIAVEGDRQPQQQRSAQQAKPQKPELNAQIRVISRRKVR